MQTALKNNKKMDRFRHRSSSIAAAGVLLACILCAHAIVPNPRSIDLTPPARLVVAVPQPSPAYRYTFRHLLSHPKITDHYDAIILREAKKHHMDPRLVKAIIAAESEFDMKALSPRGARGLMQVLPITADEMKMPRQALQTPEGNIAIGTAYLELLFKTAWRQNRFHAMDYADAPPWLIQRIIAAYNAGPSSLHRDHWVRQTRGYVKKVLLFYQSDVATLRPASRWNFLGQLASNP